jgi:hypothetical protein
LITALQAFESLRKALTSRPLPARARYPEVEQEACPPGGRRQLVVTSVRFGLSLTYWKNRPVLAPSWLFTTGEGAVIPQVAVVPERALAGQVGVGARETVTTCRGSRSRTRAGHGDRLPVDLDRAQGRAHLPKSDPSQPSEPKDQLDQRTSGRALRTLNRLKPELGGLGRRDE